MIDENVIKSTAKSYVGDLVLLKNKPLKNLDSNIEASVKLGKLSQILEQVYVDACKATIEQLSVKKSNRRTGSKRI